MNEREWRIVARNPKWVLRFGWVAWASEPLLRSTVNNTIERSSEPSMG